MKTLPKGAKLASARPQFSAKIAKVSFIPKGTYNKNGQQQVVEHDLVLIDLHGDTNKYFDAVPSRRAKIVRRLTQFLTEIEQSHLLQGIPAKAITSIHSPILMDAVQLIEGGYVSGVQAVSAGDYYEATENSTAVVEGTAEVGDLIQHEVAGFRPADNFYNFAVSDRVLEMKLRAANDNAVRSAQEYMNAFAVPASNANDGDGIPDVTE